MKWALLALFVLILAGSSYNLPLALLLAAVGLLLALRCPPDRYM